MSEISVETGRRIRYFRTRGGMTLEALAAKVYKSKATISKYEKGEIKLDLETLYDIADALHVHVDQLLVSRSAEEETEGHEVDPAFFRGLNRFYAYFYDGRDQKINRSVCDILSQTDVNQYKLILYMNCKDLEKYQHCENVYTGYIRHFDALSIIEVVHQTNPMEHGSVQILATFMDSPVKWGLWNGISSDAGGIENAVFQKAADGRCSSCKTAEDIQRRYPDHENVQFLRCDMRLTGFER